MNIYRNLAENVNDQHGDVNCYPHASANVETRGEAVFAAKNAIDGVTANHSHGKWPFASWGINQRDDAQMKLEFGREIKTDRIILHTRADFPHDNWWVKATVEFSDGTSMVLDLEKTDVSQDFSFEEKTISWLVLKGSDQGRRSVSIPGADSDRSIRNRVLGSAMEICRIQHHKKDYLELLLLGDEQESMIDRYLERGDMYVLYDERCGKSSLCCDRRMIEFLCDQYKGKKSNFTGRNRRQSGNPALL